MVFPVRQATNRSKPNSGPKKDVLWCKDYNKSSCMLESGHKAVVAGRERVVQHICAACWKAGKKEKHSEQDPACPQKEL